MRTKRKTFGWLAVALLFAAPVLAQEPAGEVVDFKGNALLTSAGKKGVSPEFKQPVYVGDILETKKNGSIKILFKDDTLLTVKESSRTVISEFLFDAKNKKRKTVFNVVFGKIRTVVGRFFGSDQIVEIKTPNAVAGIRGTDTATLVTNISTQFFCFAGVFDAYNINAPAQVIEVKEGTYTEIVKDQPPSELLPIPNRDEMEKSYDISLGSQAEIKAIAAEDVSSAGDKIVEEARNESTPLQTTGTVAATTGGTAFTGPVEVTYIEDAMTSANQYQYYFYSTNPYTGSQDQTEVLPGAVSDSGVGAVTGTDSSGSFIVISFPQ